MKSQSKKELDPIKTKIASIAETLCESEDNIFYQPETSHYGLEVFGVGRREYAIGTEEEAEDACREYIRNSIWAFRADFILENCDLPLALKRAIESYQREECENANEPLFELVDKTCGLIKFTEEAISADGAGHFLASYDGEEIKTKCGKFLIFRI